MIAIQDLDQFLSKYTEFYRIKHKFKCKVGLFSGHTQDVDLPTLTSMHLCFKYIKGDNSNNYVKMRSELFNNIVIYHIATMHGLLHRTSLNLDGYAYIHVVFDKAYTPFDNCIDLKLLLYARTMPTMLPLEDVRERKELIEFLKHIHNAGFLMNTPYVARSTATDYYVLASYRHLTKTKPVTKETRSELERFTKAVTPCASCMCGVFGRAS